MGSFLYEGLKGLKGGGMGKFPMGNGNFPIRGLRERKDCEVSHCNMMGKFTNREKELVIRGSGRFPNIIILEISRTILTIFTLYLMGYIIYLYF